MLISIEKDPQEIRHYYNLGQLYLGSYKYDARRLDKLIEMGPKMIELAPRRAHTYYQLGEAHLIKREYSQALAEFQKGADLNPWVVEAHINVYSSAILLGDDELAEATKQKMEEVQAGYFEEEEILVRFLSLYKQAGRDDLLKEALEKLINLYPEKVEYVSSLAIFYAEQGENQKAEKTIRQLMGRDKELDEQIEIFVKKIYAGDFGRE